MLRNDRLQALFDDEEFCSIFDLSLEDSGIDSSFNLAEMDKQDDSGAKIHTSFSDPDSDLQPFGTRSISPMSDWNENLDKISNCEKAPQRIRKDSDRSDESENFERDIFQTSFEEYSTREHSSESDLEIMGAVNANEPKTPSNSKTAIKTAIANVTKSVKKNLRLRPGHSKSGCSSNDLGWSNSLEDTLNDPKGVKLFQKFLELECSSENLSFWLDCQSLNKLQGTEFVKKVIEMYELYLTEDSQLELNIDTGMKLEVANSIIRKPTRDVFDKVLDHIVELMRRDSFRRFQIQIQTNQNHK